jgi:RimJ/RimL family protein N-acetyltransferase
MNDEYPEQDVTLRDGRSAHIRAVQAADEEKLLQAFAHLTPEAKQMRFMRVVNEPNVVRLRSVLASFPQSGFGLVATVVTEDGTAIAGGAICFICNDQTTCEFAMTVAEGYGGAGLGRALLTSLVDAATRRGLREMEGFVLAVNQPMLRLAERIGFTIAPDPDDFSVRICRLRLA